MTRISRSPMTLRRLIVVAMIMATLRTPLGCHAQQIVLPSNITFRVGVLQAPPFASYDKSTGQYGGYQIDLLNKLVEYAQKDDGITLTFDFSNADMTPPQYNSALDLVANDCVDVAAEVAECDLFDMIVGDYYVNAERAMRVDFSPAWLNTRVSALRSLQHGPYNLVTEVKEGGGTACVPEGTFIARTVAENNPGLRLNECASAELCIANVKENKCDLYVEDQLQLQYRVSLAPDELALTSEGFNTQYLVWPLKYGLAEEMSIALSKWIYSAVADGTLDELSIQHFGSATPTLPAATGTSTNGDDDGDGGVKGGDGGGSGGDGAGGDGSSGAATLGTSAAYITLAATPFLLA